MGRKGGGGEDRGSVGSSEARPFPGDAARHSAATWGAGEPAALGLQVSELVSQRDWGLVFDCRSLLCKKSGWRGEEEGVASLPLPKASIQITVLQSAPYLMHH